MFLELMTTDQQQLFLDAAVTMAHVDERFDLDEQAFVERVRREVGGEIRDVHTLERAELLAQTRSAFGGDLLPARAFLLELAGLVVVDGDRSDSEVTFLHDLAEAAGVPTPDVPLFLDFAQRAVELAEDAQELLATSNVDRD